MNRLPLAACPHHAHLRYIKTIMGLNEALIQVVCASAWAREVVHKVSIEACLDHSAKINEYTQH